MSTFEPTGRTALKRLPNRGVFDRDSVYKILNEAFICHVGFIADGKPVVIPTSFARIDDELYIHGSAASRMLRSLEQGIDVCVTVTLIDGLVLARSAFHHSINYRSVVIFGNATAVNDPDEKLRALHSFTEHVVPKRWPEVRPPTESELRKTTTKTMIFRCGRACYR
jgi:nitroimidazol reductase NimA-like FMN-containing flavoprotein (pyridoxamine 5'-phosphate oxidase superfamily)